MIIWQNEENKTPLTTRTVKVIWSSSTIPIAVNERTEGTKMEFIWNQNANQSRSLSWNVVNQLQSIISRQACWSQPKQRIEVKKTREIEQNWEWMTVKNYTQKHCGTL